jgi:hypothetical protein
MMIRLVISVALLADLSRPAWSMSLPIAFKTSSLALLPPSSTNDETKDEQSNTSGKSVFGAAIFKTEG